MICKEMIEEFPELVQHLEGPTDRLISASCSIEGANSKGLLFVHGKEFLENAFNSNCLHYVVPQNCAELAQNLAQDDVTILTSSNIQLAKTLISTHFFPVTANRLPFDNHKVHPSAVLSTSAQLGKNVIIGPNSVIGENVTIGSDSIIGANTTIENGASIGENCHIFAQVLIAHGCKIGNSCIIQSHTSIGSVGYGYAQNIKGESFHTPHYGQVILEDRVEIGAGVLIDRGNLDDSIIGEGTKIDNFCHFGHNFKCGKNNLITAGFIAAGSVEIGDNNMFAGRCGATGHLKIGSQIIAAADTVFVSSVEKPGKYGGFPAFPFSDYIKSQATFRHLPEMRKKLNKLFKSQK